MMSNHTYLCCFGILFALLSWNAVGVNSLIPRQTRKISPLQSVGKRVETLAAATGKNTKDEDEDEVFSFDSRTTTEVFLESLQTSDPTRASSSSTDTANYYMDDLTPPAINLKRDSILFSENPSTQRNNTGLDAWRFCKANVPAVFTGAWSWRDTTVADHNPVGALYNMFFVRIPVVVVGLVYCKNLLDGHPLVMDIGDGPFEMSPLVVLAVLALILA